MHDRERRVLVVDDDVGIRNALARTLTQLGFAVDCSATASDAIHKLEHEGPHHSLFADLKLGAEDGLDVIRVARALTRPVPAYAMTGFEDVFHHNRGVLFEGVGVLLKPLDRPTIVKAVARLEGDAAERERKLRAAIDDFTRKFRIEANYARRMLETIVEGHSAKETRVGGEYLPKHARDRARTQILSKSRLGSLDAVCRWIYLHAFRAA